MTESTQIVEAAEGKNGGTLKIILMVFSIVVLSGFGFFLNKGYDNLMEINRANLIATEKNRAAIESHKEQSVKEREEFLKQFNSWQLQVEKQNSRMWRVIDRICDYQADRLHREGKTPNYYPGPVEK